MKTVNTPSHRMLALAVLALAVGLFVGGPPAVRAQTPKPVRSYVVSGPTTEADLTRLREALLKVPGVEIEDVRALPDGAALRLRGERLDASALIVAAKGAGFNLSPPSPRSYVAAGPATAEDRLKLRDALRKVAGVELLDVSERSGGAGVRLLGVPKGEELVAAAQSVGFALRGLNYYGVSGPVTDADRSRLRDALGKLPGVEQVELRGLTGGAAVQVYGDVAPSTLARTAKSLGYSLRVLGSGASNSALNELNGELITMPAYEERIPEEGTKNVGELAPDFTLPTKDGSKKITLSEYRGKKPVVLVFGSYTCPPFRSRVGTLEQLYQKYKDRVAFLLVYIREAHPESILYGHTEGGTKELRVVSQTATVADRTKNAELCTSYLQLTFPALIDGEDNAVNRAYAAFPSRFCIVGADGKIAVKGGPGPMGFRPDDVSAWLEQNVK